MNNFCDGNLAAKTALNIRQADEILPLLPTMYGCCQSYSDLDGVVVLAG